MAILKRHDVIRHRFPIIPLIPFQDTSSTQITVPFLSNDIQITSPQILTGWGGGGLTIICFANSRPKNTRTIQFP